MEEVFALVGPLFSENNRFTVLKDDQIKSHHVDTGPVNQPIAYEDANIVQYAARSVCRKLKEKLC